MFGIFKTTALVSALALMTVSSQEASADSKAPRLPYNQIVSDVALAEEAYTRIHPGYTRYATEVEMSAAWDSVEEKAKVNGGMELGEFYLEVQNALTKIRCDHTKAELPKILGEARKSNPVYLPIRWSVIEGRGLVRLAKQDTGLAFGDEILSIDGRLLSEMITEVSPLIPVDGYAEWSRIGGISESLEFKGGAIDHFGALLWDIKPQAELIIQKSDGRRQTVKLDRVHFDDWTELGADDGIARNFKDAVRFERLGDNGAYLAVDTFVNYRNPVDPDQIYDPVFDALKAESRDYLILDLRQNGGGSDDALLGLMTRLISKKKDFYKDVQVKTLNTDGLREHLWTWEKAAMKPNKLAFKKNKDGTYSFRKFAGQHGKMKPAKNTFTGQLLVLTSHENSSASASIIAHLKDTGRATLIGEKPGGTAEGPTAGILFTLTLPESQIKTRVPVIRHYNNIETFDPKESVTPDIEVPVTISDFRLKRDVALETAKAMIVEAN